MTVTYVGGIMVLIWLSGAGFGYYLGSRAAARRYEAVMVPLRQLVERLAASSTPPPPRQPDPATGRATGHERAA